MLAKCRLTSTELVSGKPMLGRLKFGRMGWQEQQVNILGHAHLRAVVPARAVEHQYDLFGRTRADRMGKRLQFH